MNPAPPVISARTCRSSSWNSRDARPRPRRARRSASPGWSGSDRTSSHSRRRARAAAPVRRGQRRLSRNRQRDSAPAFRCRARARCRCSAIADAAVAHRRTDDRHGPGLLRRERSPARRSAPRDSRRERPPPRRPGREKRQARAQDRGLHLVEPGVDAGLLVVIAIGLAAVAQPPDARRRARGRW